MRRSNDRSRRGCIHRSLLIEELEPRVAPVGALLNSLYDVGPAQILPAWFQTVGTFTPSGAYGLDSSPEQEIQGITQPDSPSHIIEDEWIVQLTREALIGVESVSDTVNLFVSEDIDFEVVCGLGMAGQLLIRTPGADTESVERWFNTSTAIAHFSPNMMLMVDAIPNDPDFSSLWGLNNTGQTGGTPDADIDAPEAWDVTTGSSSVVIGVCDTGIDPTHPDLAANLWQNPGETPGDGIDNDGNGFTDDVYGWDFYENDNIPQDTDNHGSHVSGTIAAVGNNEAGITGVNWNASIMALRIGTSSDVPYSAAIAAINYTTMMHSTYGINVRLTNHSWGRTTYDQALYDAISANRDAGLLLVAAAGNSGTDNELWPLYPSSYDLDNIIAVAATDHNDQLAYFSCYGATSVDLAAPGVSINSTAAGGGYESASGTSMASPHVAGVAALAWAMSPNSTYVQVRDAIFAGVDLVPGLSGKMVTGGRLNAKGTLDALFLSVINSDPNEGEVVTTAPTVFTIDFNLPYDPDTVDAFDLQVNGTAADSVSQVDPDTLQFTFTSTPVTVDGSQAMHMDAGALLPDGTANPLIQWDATFYYDTVPLEVVSTNPPDASVVTLPLTIIDFDFNEAFDPTSIGIDDLVLSEGSVVSATFFDLDTARYEVTGIATEGTLTLDIEAGKILDLHGNPNVEYNGSFDIDMTVAPYPVPLEGKAPQGSLIYDPSTTGIINSAGDIDSFTIDLDAGQTLSAVGDPLDPSLQLRVRVDGGPWFDAAGADLEAVVQTEPIMAAGTHTVDVSCLAGTGDYTLQLTLNAALEEESHDGASNDSLATAQDLDGSFISVGGGVSRGAVLGTADSDAITTFSDGFESGILGPEWTVYGSNSYARIQVTSSYGPYTGTYHLTMDSNTDANYVLNEAILTVDLSSYAGVNLSFWQKEWDDEDDALPLNFTDHHNGDGVAISDDGTNWYRIVDLTGGNSTSALQQHVVDLAAAAAGAGMALNDQFRIKFQQYGGFELTTDGMAFDDITVTASNPSQQDYYSFTLSSGENVTLAAKAAGADLMLYDTSGTPVAMSVPTENLDALIGQYAASTAGTYYVSVTGNPNEDYSLTLVKNASFDAEANDDLPGAQDITGTEGVLGHVAGGPLAISTETEPNDDGILNALSPNDILLGNDWSGSFTPVGADDYTAYLTAALQTDSDEDFFVIMASPGDHLVVAMNGIGGFPVGDTFLELYNNTGVRIGYDDDGGPGVYSLLDFTFGGPGSDYAGDYYLMARSFGHIYSGDYELDATLTTPDLIMFGGDIDWYSYTLAEDEGLYLRTYTPSDGPGQFDNILNPHIELYDSAGNLVDTGDALSDGRNEEIGFSGAAGTYYVRVSAEADTAGEYFLHAAIDDDGPTVSMPLDGGPHDLDPDPKEVLVDAVQSELLIQLDDVGSGIDDGSVVASTIIVTKDGAPLVLDTHYTFGYDDVGDLITLTSLSGEFTDGYYEITISDAGLTYIIYDKAGNALVDPVFTVRIDSTPPTVTMPLDQSADDLDSAPKVMLVNTTQAAFVLELSDGLGSGIDDEGVVASAIIVTKDGSPLVLDTDYSFTYDALGDLITLTSLGGDFTDGYYEITISEAGLTDIIYDRAGHPMEDPVFRVRIDATPPTVDLSTLIPEDGDYVTTPPVQVIFKFTEHMDWDNSLGTEDIQFIGPDGNPKPFTLETQGTTRVVVNISETVPGGYCMTIGPAITDFAQNDMNQNGVPPNGEVPGDAYTVEWSLYPYKIAELANRQVMLYDTDAPGIGVADVDQTDVDIKLNRDGSVKCVTIVGNPTGLGMIVHSSSDLPISVVDKRNPRTVGPLEDISFVAYCSSGKKVCLNSVVTGWDIGQLMVNEPTLPGDNPDLDGDGATDDLTALYCGGPVNMVKLLGEVGGDVVVKGSDRGYGLWKLDVRYGDVLGDVVTLDGGLRWFNLCGGDFKGILDVHGDLQKMKVKAIKDRATGGLIGGGIIGADVLVKDEAKTVMADEIMNSLIAAAEVGKVTVKRNLTQSVIHVGGSVDRNYEWTQGHGNIKAVTVGGNMLGSSITAGVWLGDNRKWDHGDVGGDVDIVCAVPGSSVISKVRVGGWIARCSHCGILAATDVRCVAAPRVWLNVTSPHLPWPPGVDYSMYNGFLIDYAGRWV